MPRNCLHFKQQIFGLVDNAGPGSRGTGSRGVENKGSRGVENTGSRFLTQEKELCYPNEFLFDLLDVECDGCVCAPPPIE